MWHNEIYCKLDTNEPTCTVAESDVITPNNIVKFARRYLIYSLSNGTNLQKWKQKETSTCQLCQYKETHLHLFNHCTAFLERYEYRNDSAIKQL